jgi:hypothetical protein
MTGKCSPAYTAIDYATSGGSSLVIRNFLNLDDDPVILIRHRFEFGQENAGGARAPRRDGLAGTAGFLTAFTGTYLIAVTGELGFLAPVWPSVAGGAGLY